MLQETPARGHSAVPKRSTGAGSADTTNSTPSTGDSRPDAFWTEERTDPFDLWLRRSLRETFDAIAGEPIPEDLLRLIEEDRAERERLRQRRAAKPKG